MVTIRNNSLGFWRSARRRFSQIDTEFSAITNRINGDEGKIGTNAKNITALQGKTKFYHTNDAAGGLLLRDDSKWPGCSCQYMTEVFGNVVSFSFLAVPKDAPLVFEDYAFQWPITLYLIKI